MEAQRSREQLWLLGRHGRKDRSCVPAPPRPLRRAAPIWPRRKALLPRPLQSPCCIPARPLRGAPPVVTAGTGPDRLSPKIEGSLRTPFTGGDTDTHRAWAQWRGLARSRQPECWRCSPSPVGKPLQLWGPQPFCYIRGSEHGTADRCLRAEDPSLHCRGRSHLRI